MNSQLFPIGSIVILKAGTKKLMIFGRKQQVATDEVRKFDYMGCPYPEGYINPDFTYLIMMIFKKLFQLDMKIRKSVLSKKMYYLKYNKK